MQKSETDNCDKCDAGVDDSQEKLLLKSLTEFPRYQKTFTHKMRGRPRDATGSMVSERREDCHVYFHEGVKLFYL